VNSDFSQVAAELCSCWRRFNAWIAIFCFIIVIFLSSLFQAL